MAGTYELFSLLFGILQPILAAVGLIAIVVLGLLRSPMGDRIAPRLLSLALEAITNGRNAILIRRDNGNYALKGYQYDAQNQGYWVDAGDGKQKQFFEGGQDSGNFYGIRLVTAYEGLGAVSDFTCAEIAYQAKKKYIDDQEENLETEEGEPYQLNNLEVAIPDRKVVDLRKIKFLAPFNIEPERFFRVEENAKLSMAKFHNMGGIAQGMMIIAAFTMGIILTWFLMGQGGGGGAATLPI